MSHSDFWGLVATHYWTTWLGAERNSLVVGMKPRKKEVWVLWFGWVKGTWRRRLQGHATALEARGETVTLHEKTKNYIWSLACSLPSSTYIFMNKQVTQHTPKDWSAPFLYLQGNWPSSSWPGTSWLLSKARKCWNNTKGTILIRTIQKKAINTSDPSFSSPHSTSFLLHSTLITD